MKSKKKLFYCLGKITYKNENGIECTSIEKYVGTISPMKKDEYFCGAWFDGDDNSCQGTITLSKEQFKEEIISCRELCDE